VIELSIGTTEQFGVSETF